MQTCQAAAGLTLRKLPFSPWANQTELWEGHPRLWCLCRRGNSAWQLLAFRQQPVFMEIIPPYSRCSRLLLITARMKTKLSYSALSLSFFFYSLLFPLTVDSMVLAQQLPTILRFMTMYSPALKSHIFGANINLALTFCFLWMWAEIFLWCSHRCSACFHFFYPSKVKKKKTPLRVAIFNSLPACQVYHFLLAKRQKKINRCHTCHRFELPYNELIVRVSNKAELLILAFSPLLIFLFCVCVCYSSQGTACGAVCLRGCPSFQ